MTKESEDKFGTFVIWGVLIFALVYGVAMTVVETKNKKAAGKEDVYEYVIVEKYETIGSNWHLIGGRASETEYHIVYQVRCVNTNSSWKVKDEEVNYLTYRYYKEGGTYKDKYQVLPPKF